MTDVIVVGGGVAVGLAVGFVGLVLWAALVIAKREEGE